MTNPYTKRLFFSEIAFNVSLYNISISFCIILLASLLPQYYINYYLLLIFINITYKYYKISNEAINYLTILLKSLNFFMSIARKIEN